mmetsp:Transcript_102424/g.275116  ORF Transcript_102424/g.275116 Transcript_102424/m.275116 type:complete len:289 (-) Transcript_102424:181-1047(-)
MRNCCLSAVKRSLQALSASLVMFGQSLKLSFKICFFCAGLRPPPDACTACCWMLCDRCMSLLPVAATAAGGVGMAFGPPLRSKPSARHPRHPSPMPALPFKSKLSLRSELGSASPRKPMASSVKHFPIPGICSTMLVICSEKPLTKPCIPLSPMLLQPVQFRHSERTDGGSEAPTPASPASPMPWQLRMSSWTDSRVAGSLAHTPISPCSPSCRLLDTSMVKPLSFGGKCSPKVINASSLTRLQSETSMVNSSIESGKHRLNACTPLVVMCGHRVVWSSKRRRPHGKF